MINPTHFENSRPDGVPVLEIVEAPPKERPGPRRFVPLRRSEVTGDLSGPVASLTLTQLFSYSREECGDVLEAVYRFPLPGDAAVTGVGVKFGEVEIRAELKERQAAEQEYQQARSEGRQAVLTTRESPDVFTLHVTGLQPDQDVRVDTTYVQLARAEGAGWSLRIPLTTAPRYVRSDERGSRHAAGQPLAVFRDPGHRFALDVRVRGSARVWSSTHALETGLDEGTQRVRLREGEVLPDRDCVLSWLPEQGADRPTFTVLTGDADDTHLYFLAMVAPPAGPVEAGIPREVILLVDHSGSMEGAKWQASDWAVNSFLSGLDERDAFTVGLFHSTTRWFSRSVCRADEKAVRRGIAEVSDGGRVLRLAHEEAQRAYRRRISVLCIDAAPNAHLVHELAERGGGVARFLTSSPEEEDITTALDAVLADWAAPVLTGLTLEVDCAGAQVSGQPPAASETSKFDLGDLPAGRTLWIAGRAPRAGRHQLTFQLASRQGPLSTITVAASASDVPGIKPLFGARRVMALEYLMTSLHDGEALCEQLERLGYDPAEVAAARPGKRTKVYAENVRAEVESSLRALLVREALTYGIASSETAFIATRSEAGEPIAGTVAIGNAIDGAALGSRWLSAGQHGPSLAGAVIPGRRCGHSTIPAQTGLPRRCVDLVGTLQEGRDTPPEPRRGSRGICGGLVRHPRVPGWGC
ncbi:MAG: Vault protein inter-alpha-trypsin [Armatimonadetes bacterium]|nr:Vault protein inter-alpha-trypsin [Armatimonadota bacterium]